MNHITEYSLAVYRSYLLKEERAAETIKKYMSEISAFNDWRGNAAVDKELVIGYKNELRGRYSPATVNLKIAALNSFFKFMGWYGCVVKSLKVQRQAFRDKERELSKEEYLRLLKAAGKTNKKRLYLIMQTVCSTGIRIGELRFITVEAIKRGRASVYLKGKNRQVLLPKALIAELKRYVRDNNIRSGSIFVTKKGNPVDRSNILHEMKALCEIAGVSRKKVFPHNLRHLFACLYYRAEKDLSRLADILGHTSIETTRIYTVLSGSEQQRQIERLGLVVKMKNTA